MIVMMLQMIVNVVVDVSWGYADLAQPGQLTPPEVVLSTDRLRDHKNGRENGRTCNPSHPASINSSSARTDAPCDHLSKWSEKAKLLIPSFHPGYTTVQYNCTVGWKLVTLFTAPDRSER
jgi:hypothetical protein